MTDETKSQIRAVVVEYVRSGKPFRLINSDLSEFHYVGLCDLDNVIQETIEELARRGANADEEVRRAVYRENEFMSGIVEAHRQAVRGIL